MPSFLHVPSFALLATCLIACGPSESDDTQDPTQTPRLHVAPARAPGGAAAAAVVEGDTVTVYVCGSEDQLETQTRWFRAMPLSMDGTFEGSSDGSALSGEITDDRITALSMDPADGALDFAFEPVAEGSVAGLYTQQTSGCSPGLVAWEDDAAPGGLGFRGTWCDDQGAVEQVIILQPEAFTDQGGEGTVEGRPEVGTLALSPF